MKTMRWLPGLVVMLTAVCMTAAEDLVKFVPKGSNLVMNINFRDFLAMAPVRDALEKEGDTITMKQTLAKHNLKMEDIAENIMVFAMVDPGAPEPSFGILFDTRLKQEQTKQILEEEMKAESAAGQASTSLTMAKIKDKDVMIFRNDIASQVGAMGIPLQDSLGGEAALCYLTPDVAILADRAYMETYLGLEPAAKGTPAMLGEKGLYEKKGLMWCCFDLKAMKPAGAPPAAEQAPNPMGMPNPMETIEKGGFNLEFTGPKKEDLSFSGTLRCVSEQAAQQYSLLVQQASMMLTITMQQDPQLAMEVVQAIKATASGNETKIRVNLSKSLMDKLKAYSEKSQSTQQ